MISEEFDTEIIRLIQLIYDGNTVVAQGFEVGDKYRKLSVSDKARDGYRVAFKAADLARRATAELARILDIKLKEPAIPECMAVENKRPVLSLVAKGVPSNEDDA